jgi:hypothetical protein
MTQVREYVADASNLDAAMPNPMGDTADDRLRSELIRSQSIDVPAILNE